MYFLKQLFFAVFQKTFMFFEKTFKIHITRAHYYSPIPVVYNLNPKVFEKCFSCDGLQWNTVSQINLLETIRVKYLKTYFPTKNSGLSPVDAFILYSLIREKKPSLLVEIGGGESTAISLMALDANQEPNLEWELRCIEPYPSKKLLKIAHPKLNLIKKKVEDCDLKIIDQADILFIDSSHVSKIGSDVNCEILEILPRTKIGSLIHWHDILIPSNYWKDWILNGNMFWNESYMVHAFMLFNNSFEIIWASRFMQIQENQRIKNALPFYLETDRITSFWIKRIK